MSLYVYGWGISIENVVSRNEFVYFYFFHQKRMESHVAQGHKELEVQK